MNPIQHPSQETYPSYYCQHINAQAIAVEIPESIERRIEEKAREAGHDFLIELTVAILIAIVLHYFHVAG
jgi:hypothetical protein